MSTKNTKTTTKSTKATNKAKDVPETTDNDDSTQARVPPMKIADRRKMFSSQVNNIINALNTLTTQYEKLGANQGKSFTYETTVDKKKTSQMISKKHLDINTKLLAQQIQSLSDIAFVTKASGRSNPKNPYLSAILTLEDTFLAFLKDKSVNLGSVTIGETEYDVKRTLKSPKTGYTSKQVISNIMVLYSAKYELYKEATSNKGKEKPNKSHVALDKTLTKHLGSYYKLMQEGKCDLDNMALIGCFYQITHHVLKDKLAINAKELAEYSTKVQELLVESPDDLDVFEKAANEVNGESEELKIRAAVDHDSLLLKLAKPKKLKAEPKPKVKKGKKAKKEEEEEEEEEDDDEDEKKEEKKDEEEEEKKEEDEDEEEEEKKDEEEEEEEEKPIVKKKTAKA